MGILDEAIKEHLELKRQHGAGESELRQLEDEAFGAAERPGTEESAPDALAEAPTEFMVQPESAEAEEAPGGRRVSNIADLQEPPQLEPEAPAEEDAPAMEHEAVAEPEIEAEAEPEPSGGPTTEERQAIAEQPTEMYDVEGELAEEESHAPTDEELVEEEIGEPRLAPVDPLADVDEADAEALPEEDSGEISLDDEFWDEKRLSDELDQALEAPRETEPEAEVAEAPAEEDESVAEDEDEPGGEEPSGGRDEDVLEETPDFLEEAPEDDQLWFEQKPPKDFDFDD